MIEGIFAFLLGIFFISLIGHAIWLFFAFLFRSLFGLQKPETKLLTENRPRAASDDVLKADECVQRLTRGSFLDYESYSVVRDKLDKAAEQAKVNLPVRLAARPRAVTLGTPTVSPLTPPSTTVDAIPLTAPRSAMETSAIAPSDLPPVIVAYRDVQPTSAVHALEKDYTVQPTAPTATLSKASRKAVGEMLQEFLNEKNIHWGELLSGVLIVGSAVGLIFSLRAQLSQIVPMFSAVLFFLVTAAIHFAGFYTLSRWKLPSTSRGLLLIGSLLVPITCLATSLLADHRGSASILDPGFIALLIAGGGACSALVYYGGKQVLPSQPSTWAVGIMGSSLAQGFINRAASDSVHPIQLSALGCLALTGLAYVVARTVLLPRTISSFKPAFAVASSGATVPHLKLYGTTVFSLIVAAGLLIFRSRELFDTLLPYAIPVAAMGLLASAIGCGMTALFGSDESLIRNEKSARPTKTQILQVLTTAAIMLGGILVVAAAIFARDNAQLVVAILLVCGLSMGGLARLFDQPSLTALFTFAVSAATLLLIHLFSGTLSSGQLSTGTIAAIASHGLSGAILLVLAISWGLSGWWLRKRVGLEKTNSVQGGPSLLFSEPLPLAHWSVMLVAAGLLFLLAVLVSGYGAYTATEMNSMLLALAVLGCCAVAGLVVGQLRREIVPMVLGSGLLLIITCTVLRTGNPVATALGVSNWELEWRIVLALLSHAAIATSLRWIFSVTAARRRELSGEDSSSALVASASHVALGLTGSATAVSAIPLLLRWDDFPHIGTQALCLAVAGVICVLHGRLQWGSVWRIVGQASLGMAVAQGVALLLGNVTTGTIAREQCLIFAVSAVALVVSLVASLPAVARSQRPIFAAWKRIDADVVCVAFLAYLMTLSVRFLNTSGTNLSANAWMFALSMTLALVGSLVLAALRNRSFYQFIAGIVSCFATAVYCEWLSPVTLWSSSTAKLVGMAPLGIAFGFALYDALTLRKRSVEQRSLISYKGTPFEELVSWATLFGWLLVTCAAYAFELNSTGSMSSQSLANPFGIAWLILGIATFAVQSPVRTALVASNRIYGSSLLLLLQAPVWLANYVPNMSSSMLLALLMAAVAVHTALVGIALRVLDSQNSRRGSIATLLRPYFGPGYRTQALGVVGKLVEAVATCTLVASIPFALLTTDSSSLRIIAMAVFSCSVGLIAAGSVAATENVLHGPRTKCLAIGILCWFVILLCWSSLPPMDWMQLAALRSLRASCVLYVATVSLVFANAWQLGGPSWTVAVKKSWPVALGCAVAAGLCATALAWRQADQTTGLPVAGFDAICLSLAQVLTVCVLVAQALRDTWNIAEFGEKTRSTYVYFAEAIAGLAAIGLYVVFPQWFDMPLRQYWPLIVLAAALASSAVAKILSLKKFDVVGEPIARTSLLLPIVAAVGVFVVGSSARSDLVLALGAVYYFVLAAADGSRKLAVAGMTLVNIAMLLFWHRYPSLDFVRHPQLWMIPPAVSVLIASYFNRRELSAQTTTWIRYVALGTIFLSSSGEILLAGIGESLWPPMLLTVFSVLAVFLGISLKIRSFVYFGFVFLLVSTTAMVAHAQQSLGHTWPWWALGITLGIGILVLFGLFEKKRNEMQQLTQRLRNWEA